VEDGEQTVAGHGCAYRVTAAVGDARVEVVRA